MKANYINKLLEVLKIVFSDAEANAITDDYKELYEDYLANGFTDEEVIKKLGDPKDIVKSLLEDQNRIFPRVVKRSVTLPKSNQRKLIQAMPILSVMIFLILGYTLEAWHPGWLVFLSIPVSGILFAPYKKRKLAALSPFIAVTIFMLVGTYVENGFMYSWLAFLLIPLFGILSS